MIPLKAQFLHQHKDKVVYESDIVIGSMILTTDDPLSVGSKSSLSFRMPLFFPIHRNWIHRWLDGRMHIEMQTKRRFRLILGGFKKYEFEPMLINAKINQCDLATRGILWIDVDCYFDTRQTKVLAKIFRK